MIVLVGFRRGNGQVFQSRVPEYSGIGRVGQPPVIDGNWLLRTPVAGRIV